VTHHDHERNAEMFDAVFDGPHGRGVGHIAGIAGDEKLADAKPAEQQFRRHAAIRAAQDRSPRRLAFGHIFAMFQKVDGADLRRGDVFLVAGFQPRQRLVRCDAGRRAGRKCRARAEHGGRRDAGSGQRPKAAAIRHERRACDAHSLDPIQLQVAIRDRVILVADDDGMHDAAGYERE
jgi:hypothetical protein